MILGEDAILSTTRTISYVSGSKFPSGGKCTAGKISENMSCKQLVMSDVDIANAFHIMYRVVSQWSFYGAVIIETIETDRSRSMSQKLIWIYFDLNSHNYPLLSLLIVLDIMPVFCTIELWEVFANRFAYCLVSATHSPISLKL